MHVPSSRCHENRESCLRSLDSVRVSQSRDAIDRVRVPWPTKIVAHENVRVDDPAIVAKAQDSLTRSYVCVLLHILRFPNRHDSRYPRLLSP